MLQSLYYNACSAHEQVEGRFTRHIVDNLTEAFTEPLKLVDPIFQLSLLITCAK